MANDSGKKMDSFGYLLLAFHILANLAHLLWTVWLTVEQIRTGWGAGTGMDILVLVPWLVELLGAPLFLIGVVFFILSVRHRPKRSLLIANAVLLSALLLQYGLTNLFVWF